MHRGLREEEISQFAELLGLLQVVRHVKGLEDVVTWAGKPDKNFSVKLEYAWWIRGEATDSIVATRTVGRGRSFFYIPSAGTIGLIRAAFLGTMSVKNGSEDPRNPPGDDDRLRRVRPPAEVTPPVIRRRIGRRVETLRRGAANRSVDGSPSFPTVTLLQIACRLRPVGADADDDRSTDHPVVVFLVDLLSVPPSPVWEMLRDLFVSPDVLKLGFKFKQDLIYLSSTFKSQGCDEGFDKVT
ncbi:hypothetical protein QJS10_CPB15g01144 [Acorus calamus]|uniref:3'-5' exonuclease domain-containing protein n=1 Tax=Acorus calamus TaxID=4465 RepID=A0AAV9D8P3_ACOCL|nr:hypothetical protein QJS10_CPB15g01144 [Acorus calamus]